ncbi:unnamed protein product [Cladocopium goreaui]|uniref:DNA (Cytosine-5-)-methyltransferase n=1 Tax=Cladocopium goreaui TaxID=2562237 RepID=A0A9P1M690_9DINO|nr:unnamed protein product [Cladocopium goreaui]
MSGPHVASYSMGRYLFAYCGPRGGLISYQLGNVVSTACTGSGAPTHALEQLITRKGFNERVASEKHVEAARWILENLDVGHCFKSIVSARTGGYCVKHKCHCPPARCFAEEDHVSDDLYISGFTCKLFSQESPSRYNHPSVDSMFTNPVFEDRALPFLETSRYIRSHRPRIALLENVAGCLKQGSKVSADSDGGYKTPMEFLMKGELPRSGEDTPEPVGLALIPGYSVRVFTVRSKDFGIPQTRTRLYFLMLRDDLPAVSAQTFDHIHLLIKRFQDAILDKGGSTIWDAIRYAKNAKHNFEPAAAHGTRVPAPFEKIASGRMREQMTEARKQLGLSEADESTYREYTLQCRKKDVNWGIGLNAREAEQLDLIWHLTPADQRGSLVTDVIKSLPRRCIRTDGLSPTLTTNSKIYDFQSGALLDGPALLALHGFRLDLLNMGKTFKPSLYRMLSGNAMSVPVVGAFLTAALLTTGLRPCWTMQYLGDVLMKSRPDSVLSSVEDSESADSDSSV